MKKATVKKINSLASSFFLFSFSLFSLFLSTTYVNSFYHLRTTLVFFPQTAVYGLFALLHAFSWVYEKESYGESLSVGAFVTSFVLFWAFYSVIMLPLSGFGLLQWLLTFLVLSANVVSSSFFFRGVTNRFSGMSGLDFTVFGLFMFFMKAGIFYFLPDNSYDLFVAGNTLVRYVSAVLVALFLFSALASLVRQLLKNAFSSDEGRKDEGGADGTGKDERGRTLGAKVKGLFVKTGRKVAKTAARLFTAGQLLIVFFIVCLCAGLASLFLIKGILDDILSVIEPLLRKLLTSGENTLPKNQLYGLFQTAALLLCSGFQIWEARSYRKKVTMPARS